MKRPSYNLAFGTLGLLIALTFGLLGAGVPTAAAVPATIPAATYSDPFAKQVHDLINVERAKVGARKLVWNQRIADVSQGWANHLGVAMVNPDFDWTYIHRRDAGGSLLPPGATMWRENIGINYTPAQFVSWWMKSAGHKAAMLDPRLTDAGLGYSKPKSGPYAGMNIVVSNLAAYPTTPVPNPTPVPSAPVTTPAPVSLAPAATSPIAARAAKLAGAFGAATTGEIFGLKNGGGYQCFQLGCIVYSPATGAWLSNGGIRSVYGASGYENGSLGYPTTDEIGRLKNNGVYQMYQGGIIIWSPSTGAFISRGGIRTAWGTTGYENGVLGYPTSPEKTGLPGGRVQQEYQGGAIIWSPATGGHTSYGAIRTTWGGTGYEKGRLGYPTSSEYPTSGGGAAQKFQGGVISWSPVSGTRIAYL